MHFQNELLKWESGRSAVSADVASTTKTRFSPEVPAPDTQIWETPRKTEPAVLTNRSQSLECNAKSTPPVASAAPPPPLVPFRSDVLLVSSDSFYFLLWLISLHMVLQSPSCSQAGTCRSG